MKIAGKSLVLAAFGTTGAAAFPSRDGRLVGYCGGLANKTALLRLEGILP